MSKLGTKNKPCILRVATQERMEEIITICNKQAIIFICGIEPDKAEDISDLEKALGITKDRPLRYF